MRAIYILIIHLLLFAIHSNIYAKGKKISKIVVDAGHGGKDFGARGAFSYEKDITLGVSLKLGKILSDSIKTLQVIYTRTTDAYPTLVERHDIANKAGADLFLAVHVNSTPYTYSRTLKGYKTVTRHHKKVKQPIYSVVRHHETSRQGVETYVLALHRLKQQAGEVLDEFSPKETINEDGTTTPAASGGGEEALLNERDPQTAIIVAQYTGAFLGRSVKLGTRIQEQFAAQRRPDLGVKQLPLEVLAGSAMPGVLVEIGFINNPEEEAYLNSEKGQTEVALAIFRGIRAYKDDVENK